MESEFSVLISCPESLGTTLLFLRNICSENQCKKTNLNRVIASYIEFTYEVRIEVKIEGVFYL